MHSEYYLRHLAFAERMVRWRELHEIGLIIGIGYAVRRMLVRKYWGHLMLKKVCCCCTRNVTNHKEQN